ncbi:hypothetical protein ACHAXR_009430, partial [Thalassiosira sp. AJA248-18]
GGCAYHARCIDLVSLCNKGTGGGSGSDTIVIQTCPHCNGPANGLEIVPLSFLELDRAQRMVSMQQRKGLMTLGSGGGGAAGSGGGSNNESTSEMSKKRSSTDLSGSFTQPSATGALPSNIAQACRAANTTNNPSSNNMISTTNNSNSSNNNFNNSSSAPQCYDPTTPRTGRWTDEELAFRDAIIIHFLEGSLPLSNGLKLNDFLSAMLKSKQSRLTKKMKHAKLSTKYFRIKSGYITNNNVGSSNTKDPNNNSKAREFSSLEYNFVNVIPDPMERSEIAFHMQREWRDHIVERCTYLRIQFDPSSWLKSVDTMDRRVAYEKNRSRMVKRRCLMGKAMEKDVSEGLPGVFINREGYTNMNDGSGGMMMMGGGGSGGGSGGGDEGNMMMMGAGGGAENYLVDMEAKRVAAALNNNAGGVAGSGGAPGEGEWKDNNDGDFGRFLMSMLDEAPIMVANPLQVAGSSSGNSSNMTMSTHHASKKANTARSSYCDPNFRYAAPFLAGITSYIERNGVPFEHVDIWVPSTIPPSLESEQMSAPLIGSMGSGSTTNLAGMVNGGTSGGGGGGANNGVVGKDGATSGVCRLCFAGCATLGVQIVEEPADTTAPQNTNDNNPPEMIKKIAPLTSDEIFNFSLYGDYSEKFSFSSGCGLPGRVYHSGVAAWEQFLANAPPEMFERRGGAIQFGIKTALGLPIDSPNVGRIVLVLYSKHNREKDEELVNRMVKDVRLFNPCPRWKLVVDVRSSSSGGTIPPSPVLRPPGVAAHMQPPPLPVAATATTIGGGGMVGSNSFSAGMSALSMQPAAQVGMDLAGGEANNKNNQIVNLISLVQENMPSDPSSPLGKQLNSIMSLRMILLHGANRTAEEEQLVETLLVLYESYLKAGRTRHDILLLVTRDYDFHMGHQQRMAMFHQHQQQQQPAVAPIQEHGIMPMDSNLIQQHHHQPQPMMHNFSQPPGPLGGRPRTASAGAGSTSGSFLPPLVPVAGVPSPFAVGGSGQQPMLQNVVHPYTPPQQQHPGGAGVMQPMNIQQPQQASLTNCNTNGSAAPLESPKSP